MMGITAPSGASRMIGELASTRYEMQLFGRSRRMATVDEGLSGLVKSQVSEWAATTRVMAVPNTSGKGDSG